VTKRNLHADVVMPNHTYYHFHQEETGRAGKGERVGQGVAKGRIGKRKTRKLNET
jgi:hypothetical protein